MKNTLSILYNYIFFYIKDIIYIMNKTIGLNMIVKNESHIIEKTLENVCQYFNFSYWIICDTGSTDNTMEIIKNFFKKKNIKGELHQHEWKDFGYNRTKSLEASYNKTDYLFIHDADDLITGTMNLPNSLDKDGYFTTMSNGPLVYKRLNLINNRLKWKYIGVVHEYIQFNEENKTPTKSNISGSYRIHSRRLGARSKDKPEIKYKKDALLLEKGFEETNDVKLKNRYAFYIGNSWYDSKYYDKSINWYKKRIEMGGWKQEIYMSHYKLGRIYQLFKKDLKNAIYHYIQTTIIDKVRVDGLYELFKIYKDDLNNAHIPITIYLSNKKFINYNNKNKLFFRDDLNSIKFDYEVLYYSLYLNLNKNAVESLNNIVNECQKDINSNFNSTYLLLSLKLINNNIKYKNIIKKSNMGFKFKSVLRYYNKMHKDPNMRKETEKSLLHFRTKL
jgi:hypothetical protein